MKSPFVILVAEYFCIGAFYDMGIGKVFFKKFIGSFEIPASKRGIETSCGIFGNFLSGAFSGEVVYFCIFVNKSLSEGQFKNNHFFLWNMLFNKLGILLEIVKKEFFFIGKAEFFDNFKGCIFEEFGILFKTVFICDVCDGVIRHFHFKGVYKKKYSQVNKCIICIEK